MFLPPCPRPLLATLFGLGLFLSLPARAGSLHEAAPPRPFSQPAPLAQQLRYKMESPLVRELQVRLRHAKYLALYDVDDRYGLRTRETVRKFQQDHGLPATGIVDQATWDRLLPQSHQPTAAELNNTDVGAWFTGPKQAGYIRELQHRLKQAGHYRGAVDGEYHEGTQQAISGFRSAVNLPAGNVMDERTWARLIARTRNPRYAQLFDKPPTSTLTQQLDPRCTTGRVVCISREQKKMSLVVDGRTQFTRVARFARPGWESDQGEFRIWYMNADTVSTIFGERTPMPYAIFYDRNVAIHYSDDFDQVGYEGGSHGCSQLNDYQVAKWLYEQVKVGDKVVVY
ncbi:MAG: peptidoglycan-binding protein [Proteobacteria bacterium]|nr:peptidoglycan-binding protein [Pseudomonadota bacterium]